MREGYSSRFVCLCVCYRASGYIPGLYVQSEAAYSFLQAFKDIYCVDFAENVSFGRYGVICLPWWSATRLFLDKKTHQWFLTRLEMEQYMNHQLSTLEWLSLTVLGSRLDSFLLTHQHMICPAGQTANAAPRVVQTHNHVTCAFLWLLQLRLDIIAWGQVDSDFMTACMVYIIL